MFFLYVLKIEFQALHLRLHLLLVQEYLQLQNYRHFLSLQLLNLDLKSEESLNPQFKYSSTHVAQFELEENLKDEEDFENKLERFANINAAAIIFPFIRENAATISAKAGMAPIMIPVTNFVKLYEDKKKII